MLQWAPLHSVASACSQTSSVGNLTLRQSMLWYLHAVHIDSNLDSHENCSGNPQRPIVGRILSTLQLMEGPSLCAALCAQHTSCTAVDLPTTCWGT